MPDNLATELREWAKWLESRSFATLDGSRAREAADKIEALEAELKNVWQYYTAYVNNVTAAELAELEHLESLLWKTADGVAVVPHPTTTLWYIHPDSKKIYERTYEANLDDARSHWIGDRESSRELVWIGVGQCYSTLEAAEKALAEQRDAQ